MLSRLFGAVDRFHRNPTDTWRAACFAAVLLLRLLLLLLSSCFCCFATAFAFCCSFCNLSCFAAYLSTIGLSASVCLKLRKYSLYRNPPDRPVPDPPDLDRSLFTRRPFAGPPRISCLFSLFFLPWCLFQFFSLSLSLS